MHKDWTIDVAGGKMKFETGKYAKQANGSVVARYGDTTVLVTATMSEPREGIDYFPLMVNYEERVYAIGKIPGSITRREGRPRDVATLAARLIDRPLRPLFPEGFRHDVQIIATVLSVDNDCEPDILALNGASVALTLSDIPFDGPIGGVKVGLVDGELVINPDEEEREKSKLDLTVAGTRDAVLMVEAGANEVSEDVMLDAIELAHQEIKRLVLLQEEIGEEAGKKKFEFTKDEITPELDEEIRKYISSDMENALRIPEKLERNAKVDEIKENTLQYFEDMFENNGLDNEEKNKQLKMVERTIEKVMKEKVRKMIIEEGIRPDGRKPDEIRPIWCEVGTLPRVHGSGVFTRGQTQALSVVTLGATSDEQILFGLGEEETKRYMHHYNFPPYSVGETSPLRSPGRREIGHGALGERALQPVIPDQEEFPYTIRVVSEVLESNGSTSQASICGSTLALMDAGVPIKEPVAGIAMGLLKEDEKVVILSDIQGLEDFYGDMDFKVAGTRNGITALQMDIKIHGISKEILKKALKRAREGRLYILDKMLQVIDKPRPELSPYAPLMITMKVSPDKIRHIIGPGGKIINKIIDETGVEIDIDDDGSVYILAQDQESGNRAKEIINKLTKEVEVGDIYEGRVKKITNFGAFVEILPGREGLVHISELADHHVKKVEDIVKIGDRIPVKVIEIDELGRINLSRKRALKEQKKE
ncbi:polyribonucleotide nucleotidyltransferase [Halothermothrix orenii]|uniref:Polyribonucleotide nucleotidyltransferase n=1 Tax=Halothermothrix orenii (strain H 168 / OCM 544 / DSM 9562) TaxID=373903 RepID=PNP_HALOH|nr:polyribonucleotide nucleotidyltransferase [Halothermothrix orenii]B8CW78.1 RecName: Full=Polyribonucleotide nucleotidyltransferase; AltName: Full=Polynucleotide phosphorylase; Short=PNPase [Halothermothrix orenii H 168]ACL69547.1 Polyribonucleotide nucleotidyltransferase [Halothermothrix orenii H 168]